MKQLVVLAIIAIAGIANAQSSYDILNPVRKVLTADITQVKNITQPEFLPEVAVKGQLVIDKRLKQVGLSVRHYNRIVFQDSLKLLSYTKDETCGTVTYVAGTDPRSLSRIVETMTIVDNTNNICQVEDRIYAPTEVRLERVVNGIFLEVSTVDLSLTALKKETMD